MPRAATVEKVEWIYLRHNEFNSGVLSTEQVIRLLREKYKWGKPSISLALKSKVIRCDKLDKLIRIGDRVIELDWLLG